MSLVQKSVHVTVTKDVPEAAQQEWLQMAHVLASETWKEDGCISYSFVKSKTVPTRFVIVEEWTSQEHLNAHFETEHFKKYVPLMDAISTTPCLDVSNSALTIERVPGRTKRNGRILILFDSSTSCTEKMAEFMAEGARQLDRTEVRVRVVPGEPNHWDRNPNKRETNGHPEATFQDLVWADGIACGTPTNLGGISWRMKKFWDDFSQAGYWNAIDGKVGCSFSSQGGHGGGAEIVCLAMNLVLLNFGISVIGITDYVGFKNTMHYGAVVAKAPRDDFDKMACRRQGRRLAEYVGYYIIGRDETHPMAASKALDKAAYGDIPPRDFPMEKLIELNTATFQPNYTKPKRALIFTKMEDYVHGSTPAMAGWVQTALLEIGWQAVISDESELMEESSGQEFDLIVLVNNSGQIFDPKKEILTKHIASGRGVLGVHAALASFLNGKDASGATIMEPTNNLIESTFKAHFRNHPPVQEGVVIVDRNACAKFHGLSALPDIFVHKDEFFNFTKNPYEDKDVTVLAYVDEKTYEGGLMGEKHPVVWYHHLGEKKAPIFYCALGHFSHFYNGLGPSHVDTILRAGLNFVCK